MFSRRAFLIGAAFAGASMASTGQTTAAPGRVIVGAIRWDAWDAGPGTAEEAAVEASLGPQKWHNRAPWFAHPTGPDTIEINGDQQSIMDQEIGYASRAGLDYWAYCWYGETDPPMQHAWQLHQASRQKDRVNWCMILQFSRLGSRQVLKSHFAAYVGYFKQANYQKVFGIRPLLFIYMDSPSALSRSWDGDWSEVGSALTSLQRACKAAGIAAPYIVIMYGDPNVAKDIMRETFADAISNYMGAIAGGHPASFDENERSVQEYWAQMAATDAAVIPICQTGWDNRPRKEHPPPWRRMLARSDMTSFVTSGTPEQIANHIRAALVFVHEHPAVCPARAVLVYSWNEADEGGSALIPAYGATKPNLTILDAVSRVLRARWY